MAPPQGMVPLFLFLPLDARRAGDGTDRQCSLVLIYRWWGEFGGLSTISDNPPYVATETSPLPLVRGSILSPLHVGVLVDAPAGLTFWPRVMKWVGKFLPEKEEEAI